MTRLEELITDDSLMTTTGQNKLTLISSLTPDSPKPVQPPEKVDVSLKSPKTPRTSAASKPQFLRTKTTPRRPPAERMDVSPSSNLTRSTTIPENASEFGAIEEDKNLHEIEPAEKRKDN
ncbi:hypothetical protein [Variovorax soli]|uniref:Uncharacterized protein n=1 Tax=Variovorax soli TaxID=376815 RepID=A0ABU1N8H5_9BURK|nr:hypothetical protein [Variovorax soli]MDR6534360.1 hypothetical protein [Variovorax soli]